MKAYEIERRVDKAGKHYYVGLIDGRVVSKAKSLSLVVIACCVVLTERGER